MTTRPVYLIGAGMMAFGKHKETPLSELAAGAAAAALADAGFKATRSAPPTSAPNGAAAWWASAH